MKCPGQDMQYWSEDAIYEVACPECGQAVEFYKDDTTRSCPHCRHRFVNPKMDFGCAAYCQFAEQCLGTLPEEFVLGQDNLLKDKVAVEVKRLFKNDFKAIALATKVASHAEAIGKATAGVDMAEVLCSAYLLTAGLSAASPAEGERNLDAFREASLGAAGEILARLGAGEDLQQAVGTILATVGTASVSKASLAARVVDDAYTLALLERDLKEESLTGEDYRQACNRLRTEAGRREAAKISSPAAS